MEKEIKTEVRTITPEVAGELLKLNTNNRKPKDAIINLLASEILNDRWILTGEAIIISSENVLLDGQHRLLAVIKANKPIQSLVVWGVKPEAFKAIDATGSRTAGDIAFIGGIPNANKVCAAISKYFFIKKEWAAACLNEKGGRDLKAIATSKQQVVDFYKDNEFLVTTCVRHAEQCNRKNRALKESIIAAYEIFLVLENEHSLESVQDFFMQICSGENITNITTKTMCDVLRRKAMRLSFYTAPQLTAYLHKAWNAYVSGVELSCLRYIPEQDGKYIKLL